MTDTSSKRPLRRGCSGKTKYATASSAEQAASRARAKTGELIVAYECRFCFQFHIGHLRKQTRDHRHKHSVLEE
jgi:hypothetical protein